MAYARRTRRLLTRYYQPASSGVDRVNGAVALLDRERDTAQEYERQTSVSYLRESTTVQRPACECTHPELAFFRVSDRRTDFRHLLCSPT